MARHATRFLKSHEDHSWKRTYATRLSGPSLFLVWYRENLEKVWCIWRNGSWISPLKIWLGVAVCFRLLLLTYQQVPTRFLAPSVQFRPCRIDIFLQQNGTIMSLICAFHRVTIPTRRWTIEYYWIIAIFGQKEKSRMQICKCSCCPRQPFTSYLSSFLFIPKLHVGVPRLGAKARISSVPESLTGFKHYLSIATRCRMT